MRLTRLHRRYLAIIVVVLCCVALFKVVLQPTSSSQQGQEENDQQFKGGPAAKVDFHDYKLMEADVKRTGPGEKGAAVVLKQDELKKIMDLYYANGFHGGISDMISLNRSLGEHRHPKCKNKLYSKTLPTVSLVIPFHEEHWTTLLRTFMSALNRSPPGLIKEVILVDDFSQKPFLKQPLDDYLAKHFPGKVIVLRNSKREGLIRTRINGAKIATGDVLVFLDSHCECNHNWLPPLLDPIAADYRTVTCPFIDSIDSKTFEYVHQDEGARGAFNWELLYKRLPRLPGDKDHMDEPFESPVMAGGLFAISASWFWELGGYDPGLEIWGMEQYELSFKVWQCGGRMYDIPCSRIGHIYRSYSPFKSPPNLDPNFGTRNAKRVAEVWMDEYKRYVYMRKEPGFYDRVDTYDLSERRAIRKRLNCKSFRWFMTKVAFDIVEHYPLIEPPLLSNGHIRNKESSLCLSVDGEKIIAESCTTSDMRQKFQMTFREEFKALGSAGRCFDAAVRSRVILYGCHMGKGNQQFKYNVDTQQIVHLTDCLTVPKTGKEIVVEHCADDNVGQRWTMDNMNATAIRTAFAIPIQ